MMQYIVTPQNKFKELQKLYDKGLEPLQVVNYIDFIVDLDDVTSPSSGGMYKLE